MIAPGMRAGAAAAAAGVHLETLRYYERRGLLTAPERTLGGHRIYSGDAVRSLRVIKAAQRLGFTLTEVAELLQTAGHVHGGSNAGLQARAVTKRAEVERKIANLKIIHDSLTAAIEAGCDDLVTCAEQPCCPLPFVALATAEDKGR